MFEGGAFLIVGAVGLIGCIWARMPWRKTLVVLALAPIVAFGCFLMTAAAATFISMVIIFILEIAGFGGDVYFNVIAAILFCLIALTFAWLYFSNEREINLRNMKQKTQNLPHETNKHG